MLAVWQFWPRREVLFWEAQGQYSASSASTQLRWAYWATTPPSTGARGKTVPVFSPRVSVRTPILSTHNQFKLLASDDTPFPHSSSSPSPFPSSFNSSSIKKTYTTKSQKQQKSLDKPSQKHHITPAEASSKQKRGEAYSCFIPPIFSSISFSSFNFKWSV